MGYGKEIKIEENIVYNNFDNSLLNKAIDEFDINRSH
jgi:hypothetical protein